MKHSTRLLLVVPTLLAVVLVALVMRPTAPATSQDVAGETRAIASELACPVCQGISVADSPSQLAGQMRAVIQQKLEAGESRSAIVRYFVDAYGDSILLSPPRDGFWLLIWWVPVLVTVAGLGIVALLLSRWLVPASRAGEPSRTLDDAESARYAEALERELRLREAAPVPDSPSRR